MSWGKDHTAKGLWALWRTLTFLEGRDWFVGLSPLLMIVNTVQKSLRCVAYSRIALTAAGPSYCTVCRWSGRTHHSGNSEVVTQFTDNLANITSLCQVISSNPIHTNTTPEHYTLVYQHFCTTCFGRSFDHLQVENKRM
jgi:hypothetical protein